LLAINGPSDVVENQLEYDLRQSAFEEVGHRWVRWNCDQLGCELQAGCTVVPVLERPMTKPPASAPRKAKAKVVRVRVKQSLRRK
jgi:hypothetical protein